MGCGVQHPTWISSVQAEVLSPFRVLFTSWPCDIWEGKLISIVRCIKSTTFRAPHTQNSARHAKIKYFSHCFFFYSRDGRKRIVSSLPKILLYFLGALRHSESLWRRASTRKISLKISFFWERLCFERDWADAELSGRIFLALCYFILLSFPNYDW